VSGAWHTASNVAVSDSVSRRDTKLRDPLARPLPYHPLPNTAAAGAAGRARP